MNIKIVGKNIELGESFQAYSSARIGEVLNKYSYDAVSTQITLEKRIGNFKAKLKVYLKNKIELDATGRGKDANTSYEDALDHIEKKLRRYHRRMKSHRNIENKNILSTDEPLRIYQSVLNLDEDDLDIGGPDLDGLTTSDTGPSNVLVGLFSLLTGGYFINRRNKG